MAKQWQDLFWERFSGSPYVGNCVKCDELVDLDASTALCLKCTPKPKKDDSNGS